jgi:hypothetical protein
MSSQEPTLEGIANALHSLTPAQGETWNVQTLVPSRLHLTRGPNGEYAVFIEGDLGSFGPLPPYGGLGHSDSIVGVPTGRTFPALRLQSADELVGNRVIAHIAYELAMRLARDPGASNRDLLHSVSWVLLLLGAREGVLTPERRAGLVGECLLLRRLILMARSMSLPPTVALERWWGHGKARRDFAAVGIGIEAKATSANSRTHAVGMDQLDPFQPGEQVYVFSVGIKTDVTAPKKLPDFILDVESQLVDPVSGVPDEPALRMFRGQLRAYGYDPVFDPIYRAAPGYAKPHLLPALFPETELDRLRLSSFVGGQLPSMVSAVHYNLSITSPELPSPSADALLARLLAAPPVTFPTEENAGEPRATRQSRPGTGGGRDAVGGPQHETTDGSGDR